MAAVQVRWRGRGLILALWAGFALSVGGGARARDGLATPPAFEGQAAPAVSWPCPPPADRLDDLALLEAVDLALCHSPALRQGWARIKARSAEVGLARAPYYPSVALSAGRSAQRRSTGLGEDGVRNNVMAATLAWRLFDSGARSAALRAARAQLDEAAQAYGAVLQDKLAEVAGAYYEAATARQALRTAVEDTEIARRSASIAARRARAGLDSHGDVLHAQAALERARLAQAQAEGAQARALAGLAQVLGVDPATPIVLAPGPLAPQRIEDRELAQWLRDARQRHPAIKAAQAGLAAATAQVDVARATDMPTVDLSLGHYRNSSENVSVFAGSSRSVSASLNLRIPLFDGFARRHRIQGARAEVQRQEALLDQARLATGAAVARAYADLRAARASHEASLRWLKAARAAYESDLRRYEAGVGGVAELLRAQSDWLSARQRHVLYAAQLRTRALTLLAAAGELGRSTIDGDPPKE